MRFFKATEKIERELNPQHGKESFFHSVSLIKLSRLHRMYGLMSPFVRVTAGEAKNYISDLQVDDLALNL
jgi:hypothetical protein